MAEISFSGVSLWRARLRSASRGLLQLTEASSETVCRKGRLVGTSQRHLTKGSGAFQWKSVTCLCRPTFPPHMFLLEWRLQLDEVPLGDAVVFQSSIHFRLPLLLLRERFRRQV